MASNLSDSYEKVVLVVALLIALGLGAMAFTKSGKIKDEFIEPTVRKQKAPPLPGQDQMTNAVNSLGKDAAYEKAKDGDRELDTFVGIPWFLKQDESPVDLGNPDEAPVHAGIKNQWWLDNGVNPGFADSPQQDADSDGFSNLEEYTDETDPSDATNHPSVIAKVLVEKLINDQFQLDFSGNIGEKFKFKMYTLQNGQKIESKTKEYLPAGDTDASIFFVESVPGQFRFRLKAVEERVVTNERTGVESKENFAVIEDLKPNLKAAGAVYEVPYRGTGVVFDDYKVFLYLNAIGEEGNKFEVPINTRFALPYKEDAVDKPFLFKEVSAAGDVIIEWEKDGKTDFLSLQVPPK